MSLTDLLSQARRKLPTLPDTPLSSFTTPEQGSGSPQNPTPVIPTPQAPPLPSVAPVPQNAPLDALRQRTQTQTAALSFAPSSQIPTDQGIPLLQLALGPIMNRGQGGTGSPQNDINRAIELTAHGISNGTSTIPSGGPTSSVDYSSLPGMYGRLVDPPGGPSDLRLQAGAAASLRGILPYGAILGGSYRTYAQQAADYARDPHRFAPPGKSLHEYGLAIDVNTGYLGSHPEVRQALINAGWYQERSDEPWHFSYGVYTPAPSGGQGRTPGPGSSATPQRAPARGPQRIRTRSPQQR